MSKLMRQVLGLIFLCLLTTSTALASASTANRVIFLPLRVNTADAPEQLTETADRLLAEASQAQGYTLIDRATATAKLSYRDQDWPPTAVAASRSLLPKDFRDYMVTGSLTKLGNRLSLDLTVQQLSDLTTTRNFFKEIDTPDGLGGALAELTGQIKTFVNRQLNIATINISGNGRIDGGAIRQRLTSKIGDPYNLPALRKDLKEIFRMGYFKDIQIEAAESPQGWEVTFLVVEKEIISKVNITGFKAKKEEDVRATIKVKTNAIISENDIRASVVTIRNLYRDDGYYDCQVNVERKEVGRSRVELTFNIIEGNKVFIKEIKFTGNASFATSKLEGIITTSEKNLLSFITDSGLLNKKKLEDDAARLTAFYHNNGFIDAKVGDPEVVQKGDWFAVYFNIEEGERYQCGSIDLAGDLVGNKADLLKLVAVGGEQYFSRKVLREDILRLTDLYADKGYAFAEINPKIDKDPVKKQINLILQIDQGKLIHINRINIKGNTRTRDKIVRREIELAENGIFNASQLKTSHQQLQRLEFFEDVNISPEPTIDESQLDINVEVKEKPTGKFSIGAGYSSVDHLTFMGEVSENNLFGRGQRLAFQANISGSSNQFNIDFTEPHIYDSKLLVGFNIYRWKREYDDYTKNSSGGAARIGYPIWEKLMFNLSYGYDNTSLDSVNLTTASQEIIDSMDYHITSAIKTGLSRDTRDRQYAAHTGSQNTLTFKYAGGLLGGDNSFTKLEGMSSWFLPVSKATTFHSLFSVGQIFGNSEGHLPVFEKFYLGGINTIRGFDNGKISPIDAKTGNRIGGDKMWYANLEYIFPIVKEQGVLGVIFYDIGNVYDSDQSWNFGQYKHSAGAGVRWLSPMGPLRLEWGYNLHPEADEDPSNWEFSIGGNF
ncbi:MAG: outer membrane protein assembly factor BamA [Desulfobulbaceae bacterium]|nr:outer membrane protein assembly factor BamA [Desulfobulbaceae bacterium]